VSRALDRRLAAPLFAMWAIGLASAALAQIVKADNAPPATVDSFKSKSEAEAFLAGAVPAATAANPKYRSPDSDVATRWLTKTVGFKDNGNGGIGVSTDESAEDYRNGARTAQRTHQAEFAIDDVAISEETADDFAETGNKARGVMFKCVAAPCIDAVWSGEKSTSAWTDVYIQDEAQRRRILGAFRLLQQRKAAP
jgi:hypothetical protein